MKKLVTTTVVGLVAGLSLNAGDCIMVKDLNVQFKNASTVYANSSEYSEVKDFAKFLKETDLYAVIEGHTSSLSNAKYNYDLSNDRANKVKAELISLGVSSSKVKAMGFGESSPLYENNTQEGQAKNRRVIAEVFNTAEELNEYISKEKNIISSIKYQEQ